MPNGINAKTKRLKRRGSQEMRVAFFRDDYCDDPMCSVELDGNPRGVALNGPAVCDEK